MPWSSELQTQTREYLEELAGVPNGDKIHLKHNSGKFGYIKVSDWLNQTWIVHEKSGGGSERFVTVDDLLVAGWVLD